MGRPRIKTRKQQINLVLHPDLRLKAEKLAYETDGSISALVARLLQAELDKYPELFAEDPRPFRPTPTPTPTPRRFFRKAG